MEEKEVGRLEAVYQEGYTEGFLEGYKAALTFKELEEAVDRDWI